MTTSNDDPRDSVSVGELVRRRAGDEDDPWDLALVQRAEVWDDVRMRHLLDSLLAGYPIGALLLCRVEDASRVIHVKDGERETVPAGERSWQLVDGQQRIFALYSLFTDCGHGCFWLEMTTERSDPSPATKKRNKERGLGYIVWREAHGAEAGIPRRDEHLDLSRWYSWATAAPNQVATARAELARDPRCAIRVLNAIDPDFADDLDDEATACASKRLERLLELWAEPSILVQRAEIKSPLDVLEVFTRINLAGVNVAGRDVYYAAVKTYWDDAERRLQYVKDAVPILDRMQALRVLSRLGSLAIDRRDLLPLTVDRLAGDQGARLIDAMRQLASDASNAVERMGRVSRFVVEHSRLGYGLELVSADLWDHILAWAAVSPRTDDAWLERSLPSIDAYLLGATLFRYPSVLGDRFSRIAMTEALTAGIAGEPFPVEDIPPAVRGGLGELRAQRQVVRGLQSAADRRWTADHRGRLLLSVAQRIPYGPEHLIDWDHIWPQAQARRMWTKPEGARRRRHHPHRRYVHAAGNLWALDAGTNRALKDKPPIEKFRLLDEWAKSGKHRVWPRDRWWLTSQDVTDFRYVDGRLDEDPDHVERAMERFRTLVTRRSEGLLAWALEDFPAVALFAADADIEATVAEPNPDIRAALGVEQPS